MSEVSADLVDAGEIAARLGWASGAVVHGLAQNPAVEFPRAQGRARAILWSWIEVEQWATEHPIVVARFTNARRAP